MGRILTDLWTIVTQSIREMDDPHQRVLWMLGFVVVSFIIVLSLTALAFGFVENLIQIIGDTITQTAIGEFPEVVEKQYLYSMYGKRVGYVKVIEATDVYDQFVLDINAAIQEAFDLGIGVADIKYIVVELRSSVTYSALVIFDDRRKLDPPD